MAKAWYRFAEPAAAPRLELRTPAPCTKRIAGRLFEAAAHGRAKYPDTGRGGTHEISASKHSMPSTGDLTGASLGSIGTDARRDFCCAQKASKSSGTGRLGGILSGSKAAPAVPVSACLSSPAQLTRQRRKPGSLSVPSIVAVPLSSVSLFLVTGGMPSLSSVHTASPSDTG